MGIVNANKVDWKPHARYPRVFLKPLVTRDLNPDVTVNLVRIEPGGEIAPHVHSDSTETFYILSGSGRTWIGGEEFALEPGVCGYAPPNVTHRVCNTGDTELQAISVFNPPLP